MTKTKKTKNHVDDVRMMYCYATTHPEDIGDFAGIRFHPDGRYLVPFGDYDESFGLGIDKKGNKILNGLTGDLGARGRGEIFSMPYDEFYELKDAGW